MTTGPVFPVAGQQPRLMGIVNVTPDSFSDGGHWFDPGVAVAHGLALAEQGADWLDVGGESTRPGARPVTVAEELRRVIPVIRALVRQLKTPVSVDTRKGAVMQAALEAGASCINDVTALCHAGGEAVSVVQGSRCGIILMHMRGEPATMQQDPVYDDVVTEVCDFLAQRIAFCEQQGIARERLAIDPGIGFGKTTAHNLALLRHLPRLRALGVPVVLGVSRKRLLGELTGEDDPQRRDVATHVLGAWCQLSGCVDLLRVHDVAGARQATAIMAAMQLSEPR
jgi:dihydropteroate synthase